MTGFNPEMLIVARGANGLTQSQLATHKEMGVTQAKVSRWEDGLSVPNEEEVSRLARVLCLPEAFFRQSDCAIGAEISLMYHRKRRRATLGELNRLHCWINILRMGIHRLLRPLNEFPIRIARMDVEDYESPEEVARMTRAAWLVPPNAPINNLIGLLESLGAIVVRIPFGTDSVDAVHMWPWDMPPLVFLNESCPADRERFSLAHEIGHMVMHRIPTPNLEEEADAFARELLLPESGLRFDIRSTFTLKEAFRLKYKWRASGQAIIYQARNIGAISKSKYESLYKYLSKLGFRKREPNPIEREHPSTVRRLIEMHYSKLGYSRDELLESVFMTPDRFERFYMSNDNRLALSVVGKDAQDFPPKRKAK